jgi:hypothetical protein
MPYLTIDPDGGRGALAYLGGAARGPLEDLSRTFEDVDGELRAPTLPGDPRRAPRTRRAGAGCSGGRSW